MGYPDRRKRFAVRVRVILLACGFFSAPHLLAPTSAQAGKVQTQERAARKACLSGDYTKGVSILSNLFVDTKDPTWIFNQARCFQQNRRYEDAIARFQEYLRAAPDVDASDKAATEKHIADCQNLLAKQSGQMPTPPVPITTIQPSVAQEQPPSIPPQATPAPTSAPATVIQQTSPQPATASGYGLRMAGIVTASAGAAALVTGIMLNLKVNSMASDMETLGGYSNGKESQRKTYETAAWIGYSVGAACVATGTVLYYLGLRSSRSHSLAYSLLPVLAPNQTGAALTGSF
jgi:hypothetical protein